MRFAVEHIGLAARDTVALKDWYMRVLEARLIFDNRETPPAFFLELSGGLMVEIYAASSATGETSNNRLAGWRHVALRVDSLEEARQALTERGVKFNEPIKPAGGGGRVLFFNDVEGNLLHLIERPPGSIFRSAAEPQPNTPSPPSDGGEGRGEEESEHGSENLRSPR